VTAYVVPPLQRGNLIQQLPAVAKKNCEKTKFMAIIGMAERGGDVSNQHSEAFDSPEFFGASGDQHSEAIEIEGLDHIFKWASDMVAEGEDTRVKVAREKRIRRQVLEVVQKVKEQKAVAQAQEEITYLQRRVIALLQKLQEVSEENTTAKGLVISQYYMLQRIPGLEAEVKQLKAVEYEREAAVTERRYLMNALARVKSDRDMLDELLVANEEENSRLAKILATTRAELAELKSRRWWHIFMFWNKQPA
jgi:hypothetical protein